MHVKNKEGGFTLIELLIVIAIVAILAAAIIVAIAPGEQLDRARDATIRSQMSAISTSAYSYVVDHAENPEDFDDLAISEPNHPLGGGYTFTFTEPGGRVVVTETTPCVNYAGAEDLGEDGCLVITF